MSYPYLINVTHVPADVVHELDTLVAQTSTFLAKEHHADGTHGAVTADTVATAAGVFEFGRSVAMGEWAELPWHAADYTASGAMTWPVLVAQQVRRRVTLIGHTLLYSAIITTTNVGGVAGTTLQLALPPGMLCIGQVLEPFYYIDAGGALTIGQALGFAGTNYISLVQLNGANWTITAGNNTSVYFNVQVEIAR